MIPFFSRFFLFPVIPYPNCSFFQTPVKVYLRFMRPDIEYKTLRLSTATTCRQLIVLLLAKFRLRHRDPNLFFVRMEITVRSPGEGVPTRRLLVLDDQARPAELQQCRPRGDARFSVGVRRGGLLRIHDSILMPGSQYKSLLVSYRTTSEELVQLLLNCYNSKESPRHYAVHEVVKCPYSDRQLRYDDYPLLIQSEWPRNARQNYSFVLRRNANYALSLKSRISWRRSLDHSGTDTESDHEDNIGGIRKSRAPSLPVTHTTTSFKTSSTGNLLNECLAGHPPSRASNNVSSSLSSTASLSPSMSRVSCDSGFSSPSSSSRSSTASTGSPSPPASPSLSTNSKARSETRFAKASAAAATTSTSATSVGASLKSSSLTVATRASLRTHHHHHHHHHPVTVTVNSHQVTVPSSTQQQQPDDDDARRVPSAIACPKEPEEEEEGQPETNLSLASPPSSSCILTIPLSPIPVPASPPPLSVLSSSVVATLSPTSSSPRVVSGAVTAAAAASSSTSSSVASSPSMSSSSSRAKAKSRRPSSGSSRVSLRANPIHTTYFYTTDPPSSLYVPLEGTLIPPTSAPPSPSSPSQGRKCPPPPSPSAPTSPCRHLQSPPLQSTIITIPSSGPSVVSSNNLSASAHAGMRELSAALESLRTLTIRCPNYDNCFYI
ncbi:uncharacterized protein LOC135218516 [Macrobrachium nipponense]|uniref:uncharacterized protein LOC135218516 n=1 Tax=Macrobrachium nipponense TaxID=159736 RepID=UPI0030C86072